MAEQRTSSKTTVSAEMTNGHVDTVTSRKPGAECGKDVVVITRLNATPIKAISHSDRDGWLIHRFFLTGAPSLQIIRRLRRGGEVTSTSCRHFRHTCVSLRHVCPWAIVDYFTWVALALLHTSIFVVDASGVCRLTTSA
jgi:hypothetical protein